MKRTLQALAIYLGLLLVGCESGAQDSTSRPGLLQTPAFRLTRLAPLPWYKDAWQSVKACSAVREQRGHGFRQVVWMVYPHRSVRAPHDTTLVALGWHRGDTVALDLAYVHTPWVVKHELLHQLLGSRAAAHPSFPFEFPCRLMPYQQSSNMPTPPPITAQHQSFSLSVENRGFERVTIYDVSRGVRQRVGDVTGMGKATFDVHPLNGQLRVLVKQLAGVEWVSEWVQTSLGGSARLEIHSHLPLSSLAVFPNRGA
jgi:hypothetical protein